MSELRLFNSLTREVEPFRPRRGPRVGMYACGPTVYNYAHIGNFRSFLYGDLLRRTLRHFGFEVESVMNFTDVDDKTIRGAREAGLPLGRFTEKFIDAFQEDMATLGILKQDWQPRATEHIPEMIALIERLLAKGLAYRSDDGSVYFRIAALPEYGKLSRLDKEGLRPGARVAGDEYQKESYGDFVLWKAWVAEDGEVAWESPWGRGRPGWHIECSAMAMRYLGEELDLHCAGIDLLFPHHENEIAQSEGATGKPFVRCWGHCAHLMVDAQKMSKSLGNLYTVRDVLAKRYTGRELRYVLIGTHYRQTLNFTWEGLDAARAALGRIDNWIGRWQVLEAARVRPDHPAGAAFLEKFSASLADDLNVSGALGHFFDFIHETNRLLDQKKPVPDLAAIWRQVDAVLGFGERPRILVRMESVPSSVQFGGSFTVSDISKEVSELADRRAAARAAKDWQQSDALRAELDALGWTVRDGAKGQELVKK